MNSKAFVEYMKKNDTQYMKIILLSGLILVIFFIVLLRFEKIRTHQVRQYANQVRIQQKADAVKEEYQRNNEALASGNLKRALDRDKVEVYQARLVQMLEKKNLQIQNISSLRLAKKNDQPVNVVEYETSWVGSWNNLMSALKEIETEPVAVNFNSIKIESMEGEETVRATVKYKIYVME